MLLHMVWRHMLLVTKILSEMTEQLVERHFLSWGCWPICWCNPESLCGAVLFAETVTQCVKAFPHVNLFQCVVGRLAWLQDELNWQYTPSYQFSKPPDSTKICSVFEHHWRTFHHKIEDSSVVEFARPSATPNCSQSPPPHKTLDRPHNCGSLKRRIPSQNWEGTGHGREETNTGPVYCFATLPHKRTANLQVVKYGRIPHKLRQGNVCIHRTFTSNLCLPKYWRFTILAKKMPKLILVLWGFTRRLFPWIVELTSNVACFLQQIHKDQKHHVTQKQAHLWSL